MTFFKMLRVFTLAGAATVGTLQLLPAPARTNPASQPGASIEEQLHPPPPVAAVLRRSCENCHSNRTEWPLYSRIAPVSWSIAGDVGHAREAMNLSEWGTRIAPHPNRARGLLAAACADLKSGRMPKPGYVLLHPAARVSEDEIAAFCEWTHAEIKLLREAR